jgi:hypothetical protein
MAPRSLSADKALARDCGKSLNPIETEQARCGAYLAQVLCLKSRGGRFDTQWGNKTPLGLYLTIKRILDENIKA